MTWQRRVALVLVIAVCAGNLLAQPFAALRGDHIVDYASFLSGARLLSEHACLYCPGASVQQILLETGNTSGHVAIQGNMTFLNPPFAAVLLQPLVGLPFRAGLVIFMGVMFVALLAAALLLWRQCPSSWPRVQRIAVVAVAVASPAAASTFFDVQWDPLVLLAAVGGLVLIRRNPILAGACLGLCEVKPQLVWMVPVLLLIGGHWRAVMGMAGTTAVLAAISVVAAGTGALTQWVTAASQYVQGLPSVPEILVAIAGGVVPLLVMSAVIVCAWVVVGLKMRDALRANPQSAYALGVMASLVASPHLWDGDVMLAAIPLIVLMNSKSALIFVSAALFTVGFFIEPAIGPGALHGAALATAIAVVGGMAVWRVRDVRLLNGVSA